MEIVSRNSRPPKIEAVIFDLDGVIVSTDELHYRAWKALCDEEEIPFDRRVNDSLRGVSRMESLELILRNAARRYTIQEKEQFAERKNRRYVEMIQGLSPQDILPGAMDFMDGLRAKGIRMAVASSSKNAPVILKRIGLADYFDAVVSGNDIRNSKPDPEVFLLAAERLGIAPACCVVVEDALTGIEAASAAGMITFGVGSAAKSEKVDVAAPDLEHMTPESLLESLFQPRAAAAGRSGGPKKEKRKKRYE